MRCYSQSAIRDVVFPPSTSRRLALTCSSIARCRSNRGWVWDLTIAKRLTELHGGTLTIQSERGQLTTVMIKLPAAVTWGSMSKRQATVAANACSLE